ncbi:carbamoyl-phosphate synth [Russula vinacea]|nr:carbamoyl-phosphate synth [Russula vinacea]
MSTVAPASSNASVLNSNVRPAVTRSQSYTPNGIPAPPIAAPQIRASETNNAPDAVLELIDGTAFCGISFGAPCKSVAGECVFQTGMVGYTESLTDPSYEGQILVLTYPLVGNYGSSRIHIAALVIGYYSEDFSHFLAHSSLGAWLKENDVPAICGIDTRALTKRIRAKGVMLGRLLAAMSRIPPLSPNLGSPSLSWREDYTDIPYHDPNTDNLVAAVSTKAPRIYAPTCSARLHPSGRPLRVLAVDVGMKYNQIRCFTSRGVELKVVPWDYDFSAPSEEPYDGLFLSNGPGDPTTVQTTIDRVARAMERAIVQFSGFAWVDTATLPSGWKELFKNANDGSNEGIYYEDKPFFSVQFHPESTPGPRDTEFLFDVFIQNIADCVSTGSLVPISLPAARKLKMTPAPRARTYKKCLSSAQAASPSAIKALKEEGIYTILVNPNIATIATSKGLADKVYFLPVTPEFVRKIIQYEKPDGIYVTFGGQTALNVGIKLKDEFAGLGAALAAAMEEIGEKCAQSASATTIDEAIWPRRRSGTGHRAGGQGICYEPAVLVEKSMKGWKEIETSTPWDPYWRFDVVAPSQTLSDVDYNMLRTTAINVIRHLGVVGECNIQYALNPTSREYCIIEVNARLSRSSALASKATGYPLAFIAAKLGLGIPLNEIKNSVTKVTSACFEPSLDYVIVKIPRWDLKKFSRVSRLLSSSMKSVGEVMSIGRTFEETIQKAIRAMMINFLDLRLYNDFVEDIDEELVNPTDKRIFAISTAFCRGYSVDKIWQMTNIDKWFLTKLKNIFNMEQRLSTMNISSISPDLLRQSKQLGFSDRQLSVCLGTNELAVRRLREEHSIFPFMKQIDTVAAEFPAYTNYLYTTYNGIEHDVDFQDRGVMVLGSGVYRIGSSVEFDWCAVRAIRTLHEQGLPTVMVNYNPETVSTDYDEADRLYFETISLETILDIYDTERARGVILSMGGQMPNNIALPLHRQNVKIYGTSPEMIDTAENRYKFSRLLDEIGVDQPKWKELTSLEDAEAFCETVGYPVLVRPSYVLSGAAMNVVSTQSDLSNYLQQAAEVSHDHPVVITKYIEQAKEIEMDAVAKDGKMVMHYISEHVENAGVHSGDATLIHPPQDLDPQTVRRIEEATAKIGNALNVTGPFNIQFIAKNNEIKVIECNLRAARSFPFVSKVTGIDAIEMATKVMLGLPVEPYPDPGMPPDYVGVKVPQFSFSRLSGADPVLGVEMASTGEVACFGRDKYEAYLKALISTGIVPPKKNILFSVGGFKEKVELLPSVQKLQTAGYNIFATSGTADFLSEHGVSCKVSLNDFDESSPDHSCIQYLETLGDGQSEDKSEYSLTQHLANNLIDMYINLPSKNHYRRPASYASKGYRTRRLAVDFAVPLITNVKVAKLLVEALVRKMPLNVSTVDAKTSHITHVFPGLVNIAAFVPNLVVPGSDDIVEASKAALSAGFTTSLIIPLGHGNQISDRATLDQARANVSDGSAYGNYVFSVVASPTNSKSLDEKDLQADVRSLFIPFVPGKVITQVSVVAGHFASWPVDKPIVSNAKGADLASVLLAASLNSRSVHISDVQNKEDLLLIKLSKAKGLKVTCDVSIYVLFFSKDQFGSGVKALPTADDQAFIWQNLDVIDAFTVNGPPFYVSVEQGEKGSPWSGVEESLPLLLTAVADGRLALKDIQERLHDNPIRIFGLPEQTHTHVEVVVNRSFVFPKRGDYWSPLSGKPIKGAVHRVIVHGQTVFLDGAFVAPPSGKDVSAAIISHVTEKPATAHPVPSLSISQLSSVSTATRQMQADASVGIGTALHAPALLQQTLTHFGSHPAFHRRHILSVKQFTQRDIYDLFSLAHEMRLQVERSGAIDILRGKILCTLFYEPSTRTSASFEAAMKRCGGDVVSVTAERSSVQKGETLQDTIRTLACYGDAVVLRHPDVGSSQLAAKYSPIPILNAGDGTGEHPTQALLDVYTIRSELGTVNGRTITLLGDLKNGRTVHSLVTLLCLYSVRLNFVSPASLAMPTNVVSAARKAGVHVHECESLEEVLGDTDVLYVTRVQKERFEDEKEWEQVKDVYRVDHAVLSRAKEDMIVMHPLPRVNEIDPEVDFDSRRAVYFRQMRYGLFIRMALLVSVLG